jgi:hypothetical protein
MCIHISEISSIFPLENRHTFDRTEWLETNEPVESGQAVTDKNVAYEAGGND